MLTVKEAAKVFGMTRQALMQHVARGRIRCVRLGRRVFFRPQDLENPRGGASARVARKAAH